MFIAGPYTATYTPVGTGATALTLGIVNDGFELEFVHNGEQIRGDNLGDTVQDWVTRGTDVFCSFVLNEANVDAAWNLFWPFASDPAAAYALPALGKIGQAGRLATNLAGILVLTVVAGTTAAASPKPTNGGVTIGQPTSLTARKAVLAPGFPIRQVLASRHRNIPLRLHFLPYVVGGSPPVGYSANDVVSFTKVD